MELIQRASRQDKPGKGGLDAGVKKIQFILQKKIIRLAFFVSFLGDAKKKRLSRFYKIFSKHLADEATALCEVS